MIMMIIIIELEDKYRKNRVNITATGFGQPVSCSVERRSQPPPPLFIIFIIFCPFPFKEWISNNFEWRMPKSDIVDYRQTMLTMFLSVVKRRGPKKTTTTNANSSSSADINRKMVGRGGRKNFPSF